MNERRALLKTLITLSIPTMLEEILSTLLQYVDTAMVGQLGQQATAAVSVTTTISWLVGSMNGAIGTAVLAMVSRAYGAGDRPRVKKLSQQALLLAAVCAAVTGSVSLILSPYIPGWMGAETAIRAEASRYFFIISLPMIFRSMTTILGACIRATQNTKTPMAIGMTANITNVILNYILIYPCALGVTGAAIASAISYTLSGCLMLAAYRKSELLRWKPREFSPDAGLLRECCAIGAPVLCTSFASCMGYVVFAGLVSGMGTTVFAAHSIAVTAETIFYVPGYGLRTATSALVGAALGEGDSGKLHQLSRIAVGLTVGMMFLSGVLLYFIARPLMSLFSPEAPVVALGAEMLRMVAFSEPFFGLMIVFEGIFYGLGKTRYAFWIETGSMWGVRILLTFLCVRVWNLDLHAVWMCMIADNVCKALMFSGIFARKKSREKLLGINL